MDGKRIRRHLWISGRVQGVWYRGSMEKQAVYLGATGWVRNLPDGRVEAVIEGTSDVVERMTSWCREGPRSAQVTDVTVETESVEGFEEFEIRY